MGIAIYESIKILQAKKLQTVVRKIVLSVSANAIIQLNHNWLHLTSCIWTSVSCYRQLYSLGRVFSFLPGTRLNLFSYWDLCYGWSISFSYLRRFCLLHYDSVENLSCIISDLTDRKQPGWVVVLAVPQLCTQMDQFYWNSWILAQNFS